MHQRSRSELQRVSTQRITQDPGVSRSSGSPRRSLCPAGGAPLWTRRMLLVLLLLPGAWSFLSEEQEELLVELHNHYRGLVSPSASAMMPLKWDPSLKLLAEGYAAKCIWNHNPELEDTGENLFAGTGSLDLREALEKWFLEHLDYDFNNNSCDEDKMCGHYTQMVWADTHRVGCAFHLCSTMEGLGWDRVSFLVCNYYPAGNYEGERPYVEGDWCSRCPENLLKCENNLCVAEEEDEEEDEDDLDDTTWGTVPPPPPATSEPSLHPEEIKTNEEKEEDVVVPPAVTSDVQPDLTTTITDLTTTSTTSVDDPEVTPAPATPDPGTPPPPLVHATTVGEKNKAEEEEKKKEEEEMKTKKKKDEERKETVDKKVKGRESDIVRKIPQKTRLTTSGGSTTSPSLLLASLTALLALRL